MTDGYYNSDNLGIGYTSIIGCEGQIIFRTDHTEVLRLVPDGRLNDRNYAEQKSKNKMCNCELVSLMRYGCRCGGK